MVDIGIICIYIYLNSQPHIYIYTMVESLGLDVWGLYRDHKAHP